MSATVFRAPWGKTLKMVSSLTSLLLGGVCLAGVLGQSQVTWLGRSLTVGLPLLILAIAALHTVRGYVVTEGEVQVQRLLWNTHLSLSDLITARYRPHAMRRSLRTWGNGGLFSFTGKFRNAELGAYRAFVTDLEHTVVLTFPDRKIVLSPENTGEFVDSVLQRRTHV